MEEAGSGAEFRRETRHLRFDLSVVRNTVLVLALTHGKVTDADCGVQLFPGIHRLGPCLGSSTCSLSSGAGCPGGWGDRETSGEHALEHPGLLLPQAVMFFFFPETRSRYVARGSLDPVDSSDPEP